MLDDSNIIAILIGFISLIGGIVAYSIIHTIWGVLFIFLGLAFIGLGGYAIYQEG
jgi:hypothetical protein